LGAGGAGGGDFGLCHPEGPGRTGGCSTEGWGTIRRGVVDAGTGGAGRSPSLVGSSSDSSEVVLLRLGAYLRVYSDKSIDSKTNFSCRLMVKQIEHVV